MTGCDLLQELLSSSPLHKNNNDSSSDSAICTVISETSTLQLYRRDFFKTSIELCQFVPKESLLAVDINSSEAEHLLLAYPLVIHVLRERRVFMLTDIQNLPVDWFLDLVQTANIEYFLCSKSALKRINDYEIVHIFEEIGFVLVRLSSDYPKSKKELSLAYVASTSGTSGRRKAVLVSRDSIAVDIESFRNEFQLEAGDNLAVLSPPTFDTFFVDVILGYVTASHMIFPTRSLKSSPKQLWERVYNAYPVKWCQMVPTLYKNLLNYIGPEKRIAQNLILGGEAFPVDVPHCPSSVIYQAYGLTEMSCWQSLAKVDQPIAKDQAVPIFKPGSNLISEVDFELMQPDSPNAIITEPLVPGEIVISSRKKLCFADSNGPDEHGVYRVHTKDIGQWTRDGQLVFLGRAEDHLKIQGKRTSIVELESLLSRTMETEVACVWSKDTSSITAFYVSEEGHNEDVGLKCRHLPSYLVPSRFIPMKSLPINPNGKLDRRALAKVLEQQQSRKRKASSQPSNEELLRNAWLKYTRSSPEAGDNFLRSGGDSFHAVLMTQELEEELGRELPDLVNIVLNRTFNDVLESLTQGQQLKRELSPQNTPQISLLASSGASESEKIPVLHLNSKPEECELRKTWSINLGKCIDASPLVVQNTVYVGSHSGAFVAVDLKSGLQKWRTMLPNRIESTASACLSSSLVYVGCHDNRLHALDLLTGAEKWTVETESLVKTQPLLCGAALVFGSYDSHLYSVAAASGRLLWRVRLSEASICARACLTQSRDSVVSASLNGTIARVRVSDGKVLWSRTDVKSPVFSSPGAIYSSNSVVVAHASGRVYVRACENGVILREMGSGPLPAPIFSPVLVYEDFILFGCHDKHLYCFNEAGKLLYRVPHKAEVFAGPLICKYDEKILVFSLSIDGILKMSNLRTGQELKSLNTSPEATEENNRDSFSTPVLSENLLVLGSRKDSVCAFRFVSEQKTQNSFSE